MRKPNPNRDRSSERVFVLLPCGHLGDRRSKQCRSCWEGQKEAHFVCPDCLGRKSRNALVCKRCRAKQDTILRVCIDCGESVPTSMRAAKTLRCRHCHGIWQQNQPKPLCIVDGCQESQRKWNRCGKHAMFWKRSQTPRPTTQRVNKKEVGHMPCAICGWHEFTCDVDRAIPALGYTTGNMLPLCPNHHRLVTFGVIPRPDIRF